MGFFGLRDGEDAHRQVYQEGRHEGHLSHELIGSAAAFEAMKAYENHLEQTGQPHSHGLMKEMLAGLAGAEVDKLIETKGLDQIDAERAKRQAREQAEIYAQERYES